MKTSTMKIKKEIKKHNFFDLVSLDFEYDSPLGVSKNEWVYELFKEMLNIRLQVYLKHNTVDVNYVFGFKAYVFASVCPNFHSIMMEENGLCGYVAGVPIYYDERIGDKVNIRINNDTVVGEINII